MLYQLSYVSEPCIQSAELKDKDGSPKTEGTTRLTISDLRPASLVT
ncbi:MAG: hypothetical protein KF689_10240 [Gemmatimonadaceae bacterium]|nr:hypothetical protein [Gemmatimonadaceae bacterium]MCW5826024.1 hypothetical protein [Gemmatimonadaceae bacterium]